MAPFFFIKKKDGRLRPVQDYHHLNEWTIRNRYPLPLIPQLINRARGTSLFTKFDIRWGYNNVRIKKGDEWKVAFMTNKGLFEPTIMFFALTNLPATFQMMMNAIFAVEITMGWLIVYMDDMLITTKNDLPLHQKYVHHILNKLAQHDLYLKPEKCVFEQSCVEFLGVILEHNTCHRLPRWLACTPWTGVSSVTGHCIISDCVPIRSDAPMVLWIVMSCRLPTCDSLICLPSWSASTDQGMYYK
jgi:Reverse transcriptase (RNA-dependent DNA polymerase)